MRSTVCAAIALACTSLLAQTPHFEIASVRPAAQDDKANPRLAEILREVGQNNRRPGEIPMTGPDRVRLKDWPLRDLIAAAYSVRGPQVFGPAWLSDQGFDIEATVPEGTPKEALNVMLQSLLEERFSLKVHRATKTAQGFALIVGKNGPNLKPAQPPSAADPSLSQEERMTQLLAKMQADSEATRKRMQSNPIPGGYNTQSWSSITTGELAAQLTPLAEAPVVDETGLTGQYDVKIRTSSNADGSGDTVFDAVQKLGLKLEPRKVTLETVVVDQVSETPTAN